MPPSLSTLDEEPSAPSGLYFQPTKRFDSSTTSSSTLTPWDGLRKDNELWFDDDGDCLVHLYAAGTSRRGPSLKVPLRLLQDSDNDYLLQCLHIPELPEAWPREHELYIPAPPQATRQEAFAYHVGTRNYFAYLASKPLVGESLALSLSDLARRIEIWQPQGVASTAFLDYCEQQGYLDFADRPEHAVAALYLAENAQIVDIWRDAFAHCVGMRDRLDAVPDATRLDQPTRALLDRASTAMLQDVASKTCALSEFLDQDLGPDQLGLTKHLREHLDRFRSALHYYYVHRFGYFPPASNATWDRRLWVEMHHDFRCLYSHLMDPLSSQHDLASPGGLHHGGICVAQNVRAFDQRHDFEPLPHPLPLLPEMQTSSSHTFASTRSPTQKRSFRLSWTDSRHSPYLPFSARTAPTPSSAQDPDPAGAHAHAKAARPDVTTNALVREYIRFERSIPREDHVSPMEARKVRWLLVYGMTQMLASVTSAPPDVVDVDSPSYPLCIPFIPSPSWSTSSDLDITIHELPASRSSSDSKSTRESDRISIRPDCHTDSAMDYFSRNNVPSRVNTEESMTPTNAALRSSMHPLLRSPSYTLRSSVNTIQRSVLGGFSRVNSGRRNSVTTEPTPSEPRPNYRHIVVEGYGNGMEDVQDFNFSRRGSMTFPIPELSSIDMRTPSPQPPPIPRRMPNHVARLAMPTSAQSASHDPAPSSVDESTPHSPTTSQSSARTDWRRSESYASSQEGYESPATDISSAAPRDDERGPKSLTTDPRSRFIFEPDSDEDDEPEPKSRAYIDDGTDNLSFNDVKSLRRLSLNAGCYIPTGKPTLSRRNLPLSEVATAATAAAAGSIPPSKSSARNGNHLHDVITRRSPSESSTRSSGSSVYGDAVMQAAEIEEEEMRGRRRLRGLKCVGLRPGDVSLPQTPAV